MSVGKATVSVVSRVTHYCMSTCAPVRSYTCSCFFWDCHLNSNKCITLTETYCICRDSSR